jgi:N-carbamoylputrescine amidase
VAACNRIGREAPVGGDGLEFWGQSFVAGPQGQLLAKAAIDREEILLAQVDLAQIDDTRTHWPFLRDRRIDAYADLTRRFIDPPTPRQPRAKTR